MYINVHSQYSLRYVTMSIPALVEEAIACGVTLMVLTDINNSMGIMKFMRECDDKGLKPIAGLEFRREKRLLYFGIARNKEGIKELNDFLTEHNLEQKALPDLAPAFVKAYVVYPYGHQEPLKANEFLGIRYGQFNSLFKKDFSEIRDKLLALQPVFVADKIEYRLHEYLKGIDLNVVLT
jgi:DNA polymerase III alpha subunit